MPADPIRSSGNLGQRAVEGAQYSLDRSEFDVGVDACAEADRPRSLDLYVGDRTRFRAARQRVFRVEAHVKAGSVLLSQRSHERIDRTIADGMDLRAMHHRSRRSPYTR